jgi:hypothetical protein
MSGQSNDAVVNRTIQIRTFLICKPFKFYNSLLALTKKKFGNIRSYVGIHIYSRDGNKSKALNSLH